MPGGDAVTWFKVDDTLAFHQKVVMAGNAAMGLWVRAGAWSMQTMSEGFVPDAIACQIGTSGQAKKLVEVGLWDRLPTGYAFHQWDQRQPAKDEVERKREEWRERQRKARAKKKEEESR